MNDENLTESLKPRDYLFSVDKLKYAQGYRPKVDCILCGVLQKNPDVPNLVIHESELSVVSVNLYPYNPGHLIIFPKRHVLKYEELQDEEALDIHQLSAKAIRILSKAWRAEGFNLGYNLGKHSGGSIPHIHLHIVPRFPNEAGFLDVFSNTRIVIYDPQKMYIELIKLWNQP
jgi:ATP adenylyltransferase